MKYNESMEYLPWLFVALVFAAIVIVACVRYVKRKNADSRNPFKSKVQSFQPTAAGVIGGPSTMVMILLSKGVRAGVKVVFRISFTSPGSKGGVKERDLEIEISEVSQILSQIIQSTEIIETMPDEHRFWANWLAHNKDSIRGPKFQFTGIGQDMREDGSNVKYSYRGVYAPESIGVQKGRLYLREVVVFE